VRLRFALTPAARVIPAGHRIRLVITGADPRQRNLAELRQDPAPRYTLGWGSESLSRVEVPLLAPGAPTP
jgi:predicted acyl esterase